MSNTIHMAANSSRNVKIYRHLCEPNHEVLIGSVVNSEPTSVNCQECLAHPHFELAILADTELE